MTSVLVLGLANLVAIPFWAVALLPEGTDTAPLDVLGSLLVMVVAPLAIGTACRRAAPRLAAHLPRPLTLGSNVGLVAVVAIFLARDADQVVDAMGEASLLSPCWPLRPRLGSAGSRVGALVRRERPPRSSPVSAPTVPRSQSPQRHSRIGTTSASG